jgi:hypothetical protein
MSNDANSPADLSNLGLDLTEMFRPSWTKEGEQGASRPLTSFDSEEGDQERPRRREGNGGFARRERSPRDRGPRPERSGGDRDRGPRRDSRGGPRGKEGGRRDERGPRRNEERERREPAAPAVLEGWKLDLIPDPAALEGIAKQVRSRAKAYPLFELSRLILKLSDRYSVRLTPLSPETPALFRAKADGSLWTTRKEAVDHLLSAQLEKFYRSLTVTVEPPKGAFNVVAQCGMSGVLLGPPNHHEYTSRIIALHTSHFRTMPFEVFKARITMVRDEALIEQWKTEQSTKTVYVPVVPGEEQPAAPAPESFPEPVAESATEPAEPIAEAAATEATTPEISEETPASTEEAVEPASESDATGTDETPDQAVEEAATPAAETASSEVQGLSFQEVTADFLANHAENEIESVSGELTLPGRVALHASAKPLRELLLNHLRETDRFPLPLAQSLGRDLAGLGLQIFKSHKKIIHVSVARPRYLDRQTTPVGDQFKAILEYLEAHPNQRRDKQWNALLSLRTGIPIRPAKPAEGEVAAEEVTPTISDEEIKKHEQALGADLLWLLHEGHVIDFAMGNLQAATPPKPHPAKKEASTDETLTGDEVRVQPGGSQGAEVLPSEIPADVITEPAVPGDPLESATATVLETLTPEDPGQVLPN